MNKQRRKTIEEISSKLSELKDEITAVQEEEQEYYDNMPENMRNGEKGEQASAAAEALSSALSSAEEAIGYLDEASA